MATQTQHCAVLGVKDQSQQESAAHLLHEGMLYLRQLAPKIVINPSRARFPQ